MTTEDLQDGGIGGPSVAATIREAMGRLTNAERKAARALLSAYPVAGLETVAELADRAGVSAPTVVRFVSRLGFSGYAAFQRALMHEVRLSVVLAGRLDVGGAVRQGWRGSLDRRARAG